MTVALRPTTVIVCGTHKPIQSSEETFVRKHMKKLCRFEIDKNKKHVKITHNQMHILHSLQRKVS